MKYTSLLVILLLFILSGANAQTKKTATTKTTATKTAVKKTDPKADSKYPESFTISKEDFNSFFNYKANDIIKNPANKYIDKSVLQLNTKNGDMQLLRLRLAYFPKSFLMIQVSGVHSTQVFLLSDDKSISYKGKVDKDKVTLTKCKEEEIVSE
jgi:hypothetical protein